MSFIDTIVNYFELFGNALYNFIVGLGQLLKMIPDMISFSTSITAFLPIFLVSFFLLGFTVKIVLLIVGRK